jgi:cell division protein FtsB
MRKLCEIGDVSWQDVWDREAKIANMTIDLTDQAATITTLRAELAALQREFILGNTEMPAQQS